MNARPALRFTIGQLMQVIAGLSVVLAIPVIVTSPDYRVALGVFFVVAAFSGIALGINFGGEMAFGLRCPACRRWSLRRIARHPGYFRCAVCRARFQRDAFGPWRDASGPGDAPRFRKPAQAGAWRGFQTRENLDATTSGSLLENKRRRQRSRATAQDCPTLKEDESRVDQERADD